MSTTLVGDENTLLHQSKRRDLKPGVGIILLSNPHERGPCCEDTEDRVRHPLTVTGLSQEEHKTEHRGTYQFQRIGFGVFPQEVHDTPVLHPRRNRGIFVIINSGPD